MRGLLNAQQTLNQMQLEQARTRRKLWWQKNWWWVAGATLAVGVGTYYAVKTAKKK